MNRLALTLTLALFASRAMAEPYIIKPPQFLIDNPYRGKIITHLGSWQDASRYCRNGMISCQQDIGGVCHVWRYDHSENSFETISKEEILKVKIHEEAHCGGRWTADHRGGTNW